MIAAGSDVIVSGHLCIDLIPGMANVSLEALNTPGRLSESGPIVVSTGGCVSNTGLSLFRLGVPVGLMATVGDDLIGQLITGYLNSHDPALSRLIAPRKGQASSYTVVLSPENRDRMFLHYPATNDTFGHEDIDFDLVGRAKIFHFGYPPIMARMYQDGGAELREIFRRARETGVVTSMDTSLPDPDAASGKANWPAILAAVLPYVDIFAPSIEEILYMLRPADYEAWRGHVLARLSRRYLHELAGEILQMGAVVAGFKLGHLGMFLRAADHPAALARLDRLPLRLDEWAGAEVYHPAFLAPVAGTTGAGDSAYAGLLAAMLRGMSPADVVRWACAVGACNVERPDSNSGVLPWSEIQARLESGWETRPDTLQP